MKEHTGSGGVTRFSQILHKIYFPVLIFLYLKSREGPVRWFSRYVFATRRCKPDGLSSIPRTHERVEGQNRLHKTVLTSICILCVA